MDNLDYLARIEEMLPVRKALCSDGWSSTLLHLNCKEGAVTSIPTSEINPP